MTVSSSPTPLVEHELDMGEGLQARTEPRLGLADALGDCSHASPVLGIDVQDAVGFAEPERAQDDCLGRGRASHGSSVRVVVAGADVAFRGARPE